MSDDALIEAMEQAISSQIPSNDVQWGDIRDAAIEALAVARPIIEAQERERWVKAMDSVLTKEQSYLFRDICAAALKETGDE